MRHSLPITQLLLVALVVIVVEQALMRWVLDDPAEVLDAASPGLPQ